MFFWNSLAFSDVSNLISGSSAFSKTSLNSWKFMVHVLLKPGLENFEPYFTSMWDECNCAVVWAFFDISFLWDWNENWPSPVLWPLLIRGNVGPKWKKNKTTKDIVVNNWIMKQCLSFFEHNFIHCILYCKIWLKSSLVSKWMGVLGEHNGHGSFLHVVYSAMEDR